jgi:O-antigen ligase
MIKIKIDPIQVLDICEQIFVVLSLVLFMNAVVPLLIIRGASEGDGVDFIALYSFAPLNRLFILNYLVTAGLLILRWQKTLYFASQNIFFVILVMMIPLSFIWSAKPDETFTGSVGMLGTTFFGIYISSRFTLKEQLNLISWAYGLVIILSLIFILALPEYGIMGGIHAGAVRGVFTHKNVMGKYMVLGYCLFLILALGTKRTKIYPWLGVIGSFGLILACTSTNALVNGVILTLVILFSSQILQLKPRVLIPILILLGGLTWAFSTWFIDVATFVVGLFGKDLTFTGRTYIWVAVTDKIQERPWLGYGFNGFWHGIYGESAEIIRALRWDVPNSHNGYLDFILQLGMIGFSIFIIIYWTTLIKSLLIISNEFRWEYLWPFIFLMYTIVINFAEPALLAQNDFFWILFTAAVLSTSVQYKSLFIRNGFKRNLTIATSESYN